MSDFTWHGQPLDYVDHPHNNTRANERAVELSIANHWLATVAGAGLEVGNVMGHYGCGLNRQIIDLNEQAAAVLNVDVMELHGAFDWILSISTVEHVHWDDRQDPQTAEAAVVHLRSLLNPAGRMLVTVPLGWHPHLDAAIKAGALEPSRDCVFIRNNSGWVQRTRKTWRPYGATTPWAEAVWIGEFGG